MCVCVYSLHSSIDRPLGCFHILVIVNDVDSVQLLAMIGPIIIILPPHILLVIVARVLATAAQAPSR